MSRMISQEEFEQEIFELTGDEYTVLGQYTGCANTVELRHNVCEKIYAARRPNFKRGQRCPHCSGNYKKTNNSFVKQLAESHDGKIISLEEYHGCHNKIKFKCTICGYEWNAEPKSVIGKPHSGCAKCNGNNKRNHEEFCNEVYAINDQIEFLTQYQSAFEKVDCKCKECGNIWSAYPANLRKGSGCPVCASSKGERKIRMCLVNLGVSFELQKEFPDLLGVNGGNLRFDFFLPDIGSNGLLLEYQGEQHEKPVDFDGTGRQIAAEKFEILLEHDSRKYEYAKYHGINLLEIWYYDYDNIENILDSYINKAA